MLSCEDETDSNTDDQITRQAGDRAKNRINELINLYKQVGQTATQGTYSATYDQMVAAIQSHSLSSGYKEAISGDPSEVTVDNLLADYELTLKYFKEELNTDYVSAKEAYLEEPYKSTGEFDEVTSFMYAEGYVTVEYAKDPETNKDIKSQIEKVTRLYNADVVKDMNSAIDYVYNSKIEQELDIILSYWATANKLRTTYAAKAKEVILRANMKGDELTVPNISGIVSLGHTTDVATVTASNGTYTVAHEHDANGKPVNAEEYDVLQITINGTDPKAIWNFAFSVAPQHYYAEGYTVDVANNKFGVDYASFGYMKDVIQSSRNVKLPMGAGAYKVTDSQNSDTPAEGDFFKDNVVYFKANQYFETVGEGINIMKSYSISNLPGYHSSICANWSAVI